MNTALWAATWLLATVMLAPGAMKLTKPESVPMPAARSRSSNVPRSDRPAPRRSI